MTPAFTRARTRASTLFVLATVLFVRAAFAAPRVVVVQGPASDPVVARLVQELLAAGDAVRIDSSDATDPATFANGDALLRVTPSAVEVWLVDPTTGRATELEAIGVDPARAAEAAVVSVRVSEILRAHLLPVEAAGASTREQTQAQMRTREQTQTPTPTREQTPTQTRERPLTREQTPAPNEMKDSPGPPSTLALDLAPLLLLTPGGSPASLDLLLSPSWRLASPLLLRALVAGPLVSATLTSPAEGQASLSTWLAGAALDWQLRSRGSLWSATIGAGVAAVWSRTTGTATAPYTSASASAVAAVPFLELGGARALGSPHVRLGVNGTLGAALPEITIKFAGTQVASWGRPLATASVSLGIDLF